MKSEIILRKFGNSTGAVFPPMILRDLGLRAGLSMAIDISTDGKIILSRQRKYSLSELIAQCDPKAPIPEDLKIWDTDQPVGQEVW